MDYKPAIFISETPVKINWLTQNLDDFEFMLLRQEQNSHVSENILPYTTSIIEIIYYIYTLADISYERKL